MEKSESWSFSTFNFGTAAISHISICINDLHVNVKADKAIPIADDTSFVNSGLNSQELQEKGNATLTQAKL